MNPVAPWTASLPAPVAGVGRAPGASKPAAKWPSELSSAGAIRTQLAGGFLPTLALHSSLQPVERLFRCLPSPGIFTATPDKPFNMFLGSFTVPPNQVLFLLDWRFDIYQFNNISTGDAQPVPENSWALSIGWDVEFTNKRPGNVEYQITPKVAPQGAVQTAVNLTAGTPSAQAAFDRMRAIQTQLAGGAGAGMLPQRHRRDVQPWMPFTYVIEANQDVEMRMIVIQKANAPFAFFEAEFSGLLVGANDFHAFLGGSRPAVPVDGQMQVP